MSAKIIKFQIPTQRNTPKHKVRVLNSATGTIVYLDYDQSMEMEIGHLTNRPTAKIIPFPKKV